MKTNDKIQLNGAGSGPAYWLLISLGALLAALLAATLETGRLHAAGVGFAFRGALVRVITPNGDGKNDVAILCVENPKDSAVSGRIFDLRGHVVGDMAFVKDASQVNAALPVAQCKTAFPAQFALADIQALSWDGRAPNGAVVSGGVYVYRIESEEAAVTGTVVVVR